MVGAFDFRIDTSGVTVVIARLPVAPTCRDEDAIDASIKALKKDLDMVAATMKEACAGGLMKRPPSSLFRPIPRSREGDAPRRRSPACRMR